MLFVQQHCSWQWSACSELLMLMWFYSRSKRRGTQQSPIFAQGGYWR